MNICNHYYTQYNRRYLPERHIELCCSKQLGCGEVIKKGLIFYPEDYIGNGMEIATDRIVWEDGTVIDYEH